MDAAKNEWATLPWNEKVDRLRDDLEPMRMCLGAYADLSGDGLDGNQFAMVHHDLPESARNVLLVWVLGQLLSAYPQNVVRAAALIAEEARSSKALAGLFGSAAPP